MKREDLGVRLGESDSARALGGVCLLVMVLVLAFLFGTGLGLLWLAL